MGRHRRGANHEKNNRTHRPAACRRGAFASGGMAVQAGRRRGGGQCAGGPCGARRRGHVAGRSADPALPGADDGPADHPDERQHRQRGQRRRIRHEPAGHLAERPQDRRAGDLCLPASRRERNGGQRYADRGTGHAGDCTERRRDSAGKRQQRRHVHDPDPGDRRHRRWRRRQLRLHDRQRRRHRQRRGAGRQQRRHHADDPRPAAGAAGHRQVLQQRHRRARRCGEPADDHGHQPESGAAARLPDHRCIPGAGRGRGDHRGRRSARPECELQRRCGACRHPGRQRGPYRGGRERDRAGRWKLHDRRRCRRPPYRWRVYDRRADQPHRRHDAVLQRPGHPRPGRRHRPDQRALAAAGDQDGQ